jgi:CBS domain-containing protein
MISISDIMSTDLKTVTPTTPIYEALDLLAKNRVSGLPVVDNFNQVVGIITEKDVLRILIDKNLDVKKLVYDYMSREVICFTEDDDAIDICKFFLRNNIRRVPIVRDGKLVGVVSRRDIVPLIMEAISKISDFRYV